MVFDTISLEADVHRWTMDGMRNAETKQLARTY